MRGFRGSRSAQNEFNSRFGRDHQTQSREVNSGVAPNGGQPNRPKLPDWLKTPETRALEKKEAQQSIVQNQQKPLLPRPALSIVKANVKALQPEPLKNAVPVVAVVTGPAMATNKKKVAVPSNSKSTKSKAGAKIKKPAAKKVAKGASQKRKAA